MSDWIEPQGQFAKPTDLIEACFNAASQAALLDADQLPPGFFDLSSGIAGEWLQKLDTYRIRLALVADWDLLSTRFRDLLAEEKGRRRFGVFSSRQLARDFLSGT